MAWEVVPRARDGHMLFLHRLQQGGLGARRGAVDFVGHQKLGKDRAGDEAEAALAGGVLLEHFRAENVGGHQVGRELHAAGVETERNAHRFHQLGLGEAGHADQQRMAAGQHRDDGPFHHLLLAEDDGADRVLGGAHMGGRGLGRAHDHIFQLFNAFTACRRHVCPFRLPIRAGRSGFREALAQRRCNKRTKQLWRLAESASLF